MSEKTSFFDKLPHPAIIAHRGASSDAPENTLTAFNLAVKQGADAIELDVKLCADDEVVVMHDASVDRTTNGKGMIKDLHLDDLKKLDAGVLLDGRYMGEKIPTLAEVFADVGEKILVNVELTNYTTLWDDLPLLAGHIVRRFGLENRVLFSSFNPIALVKAGRAYPEIPRALLAGQGAGRFWERMRFLIRLLGCEAYHPEIGDVNPIMVERMHGNNYRVLTYTVNDRKDIERMVAWDVDGIFTDNVPLAIDVILSGDRNEC